METIVECAVGALLFALGYRGFTGKWPWQQQNQRTPRNL